MGVYYSTQHTNKRGVQQIAANLPPETSRQVISKYSAKELSSIFFEL